MKRFLKLRKIICMILMIINSTAFIGCTSLKGSSVDVQKAMNGKEAQRILNYDEVKDSLIRFHVIANSDSDEDQNLKLKVRDVVIDYLYPYLNSSQSLEESRQIIKDNMDKVKQIAEEVIKNNNYNYCVRDELSRENFPDKSYGNITLPQGNYEAFRIIIGSGQGKNWWCVMFPPLCFVDESKAQVEYDKTEDRIKSAQNESNIEAGLKEDKNKQKDIKIKFKIVELLKDVFK